MIIAELASLKEQNPLLIFDNFSGHIESTVMEKYSKFNLNVLPFPPNTTPLI